MPRKLLKIDSPELFMINFSGRPTDNNPQGHRQFSMVIPSEEMAEDMKADGWSVWYTKESDKYGGPKPCITVEMRFHHEKDLEYLNPKIYRCTRKKPEGVLLTEDLVSDLDRDEIEDTILWINPSRWNVNGKTGIKAYVDSLWVKVEDSDPTTKFWGYPDEEELHFEE